MKGRYAIVKAGVFGLEHRARSEAVNMWAVLDTATGRNVCSHVSYADAMRVAVALNEGRGAEKLGAQS